ncbi:MAG: GNAT family N-acetyltransferase [Betaproteobacteria bacterium]|nr:GNAT family N-acetyltransferase [Betaproteobacteria bacterium]
MPPALPTEKPIDAAAFSTPRLRAIEVTEANADVLQRFFDANPEYFLATGGEPPRPNEALEEVRDVPPNGFPYTRMLILCWVDAAGEAAAMASLTFGLFIPAVLHVGLLIVATARHGDGTARECHDAIEREAREHGYQWLRLGVVQGNARAEAFWARCGYVETRVRDGIPMGRLTQSVRVMVKPLGDAGIEEYLAQVTRDQPGQP